MKKMFNKKNDHKQQKRVMRRFIDRNEQIQF